MNENIKIYLLIGTYQFEEGYKIIRAYISRELAEKDLKMIQNVDKCGRKWIVEEIEIFDTENMNKETLEIKNITEELNVGDLAIAWYDGEEESAVIGQIKKIDSDSVPYKVGEEYYTKAVKFESIEQFKELISKQLKN